MGGINLLNNISGRINIKFENKNFLNQFWLSYESKILEYEIYTKNSFQNMERLIVLKYIDNGWKNLLQKINFLRESVLWRSYGGYNPLFEYQNEAFQLFKNQWFITKYS